MKYVLEGCHLAEVASQEATTQPDRCQIAARQMCSNLSASAASRFRNGIRSWFGPLSKASAPINWTKQSTWQVLVEDDAPYS